MRLPQRHKGAKAHKELNINELPCVVFVPLCLSGKKNFSEWAQYLNLKTFKKSI